MSQKEFPRPAELLPHEGPMVMVDRVVDWSDDKVVVAAKVGPAGLLPENDDGSVSASMILEYMAQAVGCAVGLIDQQRGRKIRVGFLLGTRELKLSASTMRIGSQMMIHAKHLFGDDRLGSFACEVWMNDQLFASATLNVFAGSIEEVPT